MGIKAAFSLIPLAGGPSAYGAEDSVEDQRRYRSFYPLKEWG